MTKIMATPKTDTRNTLIWMESHYRWALRDLSQELQLRHLKTNGQNPINHFVKTAGYVILKQDIVYKFVIRDKNGDIFKTIDNILENDGRERCTFRQRR